MIILEGYDNIKEIRRRPGCALFSGRHIQTSRPVILRYYPAENLSTDDFAQFTHEYNLLKQIQSDHVVKVLGFEKALVPPYSGLVLVYPDESRISLKDYFLEKRIEITEFLDIAIQLATAVNDIHKVGIINKEITPANIIIRPETRIVKIREFGFPTIAAFNEKDILDPLVLEDTLPYISPEQTGRMNRGMDYRSGFYSLGTIFYALLIGEPPFKSKDPLDIIFSHIARRPTPPFMRREDIAPVISDIVMKLLAKIPEDRYRSAYGLRADLINCQQQLSRDKMIVPFALGQMDVLEQFQLPQKLYGRDEQVAKLVAKFERIRQGYRAVTMVTGYPGIGKSSLIHELYKPMITTGGYFITGKYDKFHQNIPYSAIIQAFQEMVKHILRESTAQIEAWKEKLLAALGKNGQVIIDVIPEIELIIGPQPPASDVSPTDAQNRFHIVCEKFLRVFARKEHPLVMFLDDLQWADSASLQLIEKFFTGSLIQNCYFIGAYRNNEVNDHHPLSLMLKSGRKKGLHIDIMSLCPIQEGLVRQLIADALSRKPDEVHSLAQIVYEKTRGNPFFVGQFLRSLYSEKLLTFNFESGVWQWDIKKIEAKDITDNVVDLMSEKIKKLPRNTQDLLKLAACIGNRFDLNTLSVVAQKPLSATVNDLWDAVTAGFIVTEEESYHYLRELMTSSRQQIFRESDELSSPEAEVILEFLHDRVRQTVYALVPVPHRNALHFKIGKLMLENTAKQDLHQKIFGIVNQLNHGIDFLANQQNRNELAGLNLMAGQKAKDSTAYALAVSYLETGEALLSDDCWTSNYELAFSMYKEKMECEYLNFNFDEAEKAFHSAFTQAKSPENKASLCNLKMIIFASGAKHREAFDIGVKGLRLLGIKLPKRVGLPYLLKTFFIIKMKLANRKIAQLLELPETSDPRQLLIMKMLTNLTFSAYICHPYLTIIIALKIIELTLRHGNSVVAPLGYVIYGASLCGIFGNYKKGSKFGELALRINEKFGCLELNPKIFLYYGSGIIFWQSHIKHGLNYNCLGLRFAEETGDLNYAVYHIQSIIMFQIAGGTPLDDIYKECEKNYAFVARSKDVGALNYLESVKQTVRCLKGETLSEGSLDDEIFREELHLKQIVEDDIKVILLRHYILKLRLLYIMEDYEGALEMGQESEKLLRYHLGSIEVPEHYFYYSLVLTSLYDAVAKQDKRRYWRVLKRNQERINKMAKNCPENFLHKYLLVAAEIARIAGNERKAMEFYQTSIRSAREHGYLHIEAIANEQAAKFYMSIGLDSVSRTLINEAKSCYLRWGASRKAVDLEEKYPSISAPFLGAKSVSAPKPLDYGTVVNSLQTISTEIVLDKLLKKLMKIVVESAGAQKALFISRTGDNLYVEAMCTIENEGVTIVRSEPVEKRDDLLLAVINYVGRTKKHIVLDDAARQREFVCDPYVVRNRPKSILCLPVIRESELIALLYLENNIATGAFTPDRIEVLQLLASQAAISIENARLYNSTIQKEKSLRALSERLVSLSSELVLTEERERRRIAVDLHERLGHALTNARINLGLLRESADAACHSQLLEKIAELIDQSIQDIQSLTFELSPPVLYDLGLEAAIEWLAYQTHEQHGIHVKFDGDKQPKPIDESVRVLLFRATRELLFNIVKHASAQHAKISANREGDNIRIEIQDDGIGFDVSEISDSIKNRGGFGLFSIRERLNRVGGYLNIESTQGKGTKVTLVSPIKCNIETT